MEEHASSFVATALSGRRWRIFSDGGGLSRALSFQMQGVDESFKSAHGSGNRLNYESIRYTVYIYDTGTCIDIYMYIYIYFFFNTHFMYMSMHIYILYHASPDFITIFRKVGINGVCCCKASRLFMRLLWLWAAVQVLSAELPEDEVHGAKGS